MEAGADALCLKPMTLDELGQTFARHGLATPDAAPQGEPAADADTHADLRGRVRDALAADMRTLDAYLRSADYEAARTVAHRMSGCASWFQLDAVTTAAREIECALDAGEPFDTALTELRDAVG